MNRKSLFNLLIRFGFSRHTISTSLTNPILAITLSQPPSQITIITIIIISSAEHVVLYLSHFKCDCCCVQSEAQFNEHLLLLLPNQYIYPCMWYCCLLLYYVPVFLSYSCCHRHNSNDEQIHIYNRRCRC